MNVSDTLARNNYWLRNEACKPFDDDDKGNTMQEISTQEKSCMYYF